MVFGLPLLMLPALVSRAVPHPAPEQFVCQLWPFGFFGLFFLVGTQLFWRMHLIEELKSYTPWLLIQQKSLGLNPSSAHPKAARVGAKRRPPACTSGSL